MECRGIKFDRNGLILARPFQKFFNYGERGSDLPVHMPHYITHKMDGSMVHPVLLDRRLFFHTRKGHTDVALKAERYVLSEPKHNYQGFCLAVIEAGYTPIFEFTSPNNRIVLRYETDALTLLAMRNMVTGTLMPRDMLVDWCRGCKVPYVEEFSMDLVGNVKQFITHTRGLTDAEGYVVYFPDYMVKIKAEDYVLKHRALDDLGSKKKVVALCAQGFMDDVLPILSEADAEELVAFNHALQAEITDHQEVVNGLYMQYINLRLTDASTARKEFAVGPASRALKHHGSAAFAAIDGKDPRLAIINHLIRNYDQVATKWRGE
jgi:RNA ligase